MSLFKPISYESVAMFMQQAAYTPLGMADVFERYETLDTDENERCGIDGVAALVSGMFGAYEDNFVQAIFNFMNTDGSGRVDPGKVMCALNLLCTGTPEDKVRVFFNGFDEDNSDTLSREEFAAMLVAVLVDSSVLLTELVNMCAGGASALFVLFVSFSPPLTLYAGVQGQPIDLFEFSIESATELANHAFDVADADGSGEIDYAEFAAWAQVTLAVFPSNVA